MLPLQAIISAVVGMFLMYQAATNPRLSVIPWGIGAPPVASSTTTTTATAAASPVTVIWTVTETISFPASSLPVEDRAFALSNTAWLVALVAALIVALVAGLLLGRRSTRANAPVYQPPFDFNRPQRVNLLDSIDLDELLPWVPFSPGPLDSPPAEPVSTEDMEAQDEQEESCDDFWSILSEASDEERIDGLERDFPEVDEGTSGNDRTSGSEEPKESTNSSRDLAVAMPGAFPGDFEAVAERCPSPIQDAAATEPAVTGEAPAAEEATPPAITTAAEEVEAAGEDQAVDDADAAEESNNALQDGSAIDSPSEEQLEESELSEEQQTFDDAPTTGENDQAVQQDSDESSRGSDEANDDIEMGEVEEEEVVVAESHPVSADTRPALIDMLSYRNPAELDADSDDDCGPSEADLNESDHDTEDDATASTAEASGQKMDFEDECVLAAGALATLSIAIEGSDVELPDYHEEPRLNEYFSWTRPEVPAAIADLQQDPLGGVVSAADSEMDPDESVVDPVDPESDVDESGVDPIGPEMDVDGGVVEPVDSEMDVDEGVWNPVDTEMDSDADCDSESLVDAYTRKDSHFEGALTQGSEALPSAVDQFPASTQQENPWPANLEQMQQHAPSSTAAFASTSALTPAGGALKMFYASSATQEVAEEPATENQPSTWMTDVTAALSAPTQPNQLKHNSRPQYGYKNARPDRQPNRRITQKKTAGTRAQISMLQGAAIHDFKGNYNSEREREVMNHWHNCHNETVMTTQQPEEPVNPFMMPPSVNATFSAQASSSLTQGAHLSAPSAPVTGTTGNDEAATTLSATREIQMGGNSYEENSQQVTPVSYTQEQEHPEPPAEQRLVAALASSKGKKKANDGPHGTPSSLTIDEQRSIKGDIDFLDGELAKEARDIIRRACAEHRDLGDDDEIYDLELPDHVLRELRRYSESIGAMRDDLSQIIGQLHGQQMWTLSERVTQILPGLFKDARHARDALVDANNVPDDALCRILRLAQQKLEWQNQGLDGPSQVTEQENETPVQQQASTNSGSTPALIWTNFIFGKAASQDYVTVAEVQRRLYENFRETVASIESWNMDYNSNEVAMMAGMPESEVDGVFSLLRAGADFVEKDPPQDGSHLLAIPRDILLQISTTGTAAQRELRKLRDASAIHDRFFTPIKDCQVIIEKMRAITRAKNHLRMQG